MGSGQEAEDCPTCKRKARRPTGGRHEIGVFRGKNLGGGKSTDRSSETKPGKQGSADTGLCGTDLMVEKGGKDNQKGLETL